MTRPCVLCTCTWQVRAKDDSSVSRWVVVPADVYPAEAKEDTYGWRAQIKTVKKSANGKTTTYAIKINGFEQQWFTEFIVGNWEFISE